MAEYRLCYKKGGKGYAKNHAAYIMREEGYKSKEDLIYKENGNMPSFIDGTSAIDFWSAADLYERANSNVYREFELNIPNELNHEQALELIQNFVKKELDNQPYSFAIHDEKKDGERNLHCHLMFSERSLDGIVRDKDKYFKRANSKDIEKGGAKKNEYFKTIEALKNLRKSWEDEQNKMLEKLGIEARVDCRTLEARRVEALANGDIVLAESLDRNPVNIGKEILNKVKYKGEDKLSEIEKEKYDNFKSTKEKKYSNERILDIKNGKVIPTEEECKNRLEYLDNKNLDLIAINIISMGEHKKLESRINSIKINFNNIEAFKNIRMELEERKNELELQARDTKKYKSLTYFLKQDLKQEKDIYNNILESQYTNKTGDIENSINEQEKISNIEYQKLYEKYSKYSLDKLEFKLKEIEHEKPQEKAEAIITNYRKEALISNYILFNEELKSIEQRKLAQEAINADTKVVTEQINNIKEKLNFIDEEYQSLNKRISGNQEKIKDLERKIIEQNNNEKIVISEMINSKKININESTRDIVKRNIDIEIEYQKSQKSFEYYSKNNKEEKYNRAIYNISKKLEILSKEKEISRKKINGLDKKEVNDILRGIREENKNILDTSKPKLDSLMNAQKNLEKIDDNMIKKLAINKMTKDHFMKIHKEKIKLDNEIKSLNTELGKLGRFDFMKKGKISSEISKKSELFNTFAENEKSMISSAEKSPDYNKNFAEIKGKIDLAQNNLSNKIIIEKTIVIEKNTEQKTIANINKSQNGNTRFPKLQQAKGVSAGAANKSTSLANILNQIEQDNYVGGNNLDLNLKNEEEEWTL